MTQSTTKPNVKVVGFARIGFDAQGERNDGAAVDDTVDGTGAKFRCMSACTKRSPALLPCEPTVQKVENLGDVELDIFKIEVFLIVLLHLEQIVKFEIELKEAAISPWVKVSVTFMPKQVIGAVTQRLLIECGFLPCVDVCLCLGGCTFVVQRDNKGAREWAGKVKEDICPPVLWHVAPLNDTFLLKLLVREFVRSEDLLFLLLACLAFGLAADVVQV